MIAVKEILNSNMHIINIIDMRSIKNYPNILHRLCYGLLIVFTLMFVAQLEAQQKIFTILQSDGIVLKIPINGLKLTFDNNGSFSCWQNGSKHDMSFTSVKYIFFSDQSTPTKTIEKISISDEIKVYPNPTSGIVNVEFISEMDNPVEITVTNLAGAVIFSKVIYETSLFLEIHFFCDHFLPQHIQMLS